MQKSEFSETQFVVGYLRELFDGIRWPFSWYMPSTREEAQNASDFVLRHYGASGGYRFSEFYQFKRSKYFDREVFDSSRGSVVLDTGAVPKYGFNIYNSRETAQFNVLQRLARMRRNRVYYCAPAFHTMAEFNRYFSTNSVIANSRLFPLSHPVFRRRIALDSHHQVIFNRDEQHLCSDPIAIDGYSADKRNLSYESGAANEEESLRKDISVLYGILRDALANNDNQFAIRSLENNFFSVRNLLLGTFNIQWVIYPAKVL